MLSPLVSDTVEEIFGMKRTALPDPRTAVALGAALQGAVLAGRLGEVLLLDVTPFPLGIRARQEDGEMGFSRIIDRNATIPVKKSKIFSTTSDNQPELLIEIYNGQIDSQSRIGHFRLTEIPPAPKGVPEIEVTFDINESCVLKVTAVDLGTGRSNTLQVTDTTLLSPREVEAMSQRHLHQRKLEELRRELHALGEEAVAIDVEPACREFRERLGAHRPSRQVLDAATQRMLAEMYGNESTEVESELLSLRAPLRDLTATVREYLALPDEVERMPTGRHLADQLAEHIDRMRRGMARMARWNDVLAALAAAESDPLQRFRDLHDAGDHGRALRALDELTSPLSDPEDLHRRLRCLAGAGDVEGYRRTLIEDAARLPAIVMDPECPELFLPSARSALVRVSDGAGNAGNGFLISDRHVLTSRRWLAERDAATTVRLAAGARSVRHVFLPDSAAVDAAVVLLEKPVPTLPLRLGFPRLTHIGDLVWAAAPDELLPGLVEKFEAFPDHGLQLYKTDLRLPPEAAGGPLLNELGEVIGALVLRGESQPAFAVSADSLASLLASAGFGLTGPGGGDDR